MATLPRALQDLIDELSLLPGVGPRTAERYAYHILKSDKNKVARLSKSLDSVHSGVKQCPVTFALINSDEEVSALYSNAERSKQQIAVVEDPFDVLSLEKTGKFRGTYHVLGGLLSPIDGITPGALTIQQLVRRISEDSVTELILATNASVEGESTALYIQKQLADIDSLEISRLARGLPVGVDLEYADQITLARALEGRQVV